VSTVIVDYGSGNLHSAAKAFERAARDTAPDQSVIVSRDPEAVRRAERIVLQSVCSCAE
jgi:glutamine amidotransferase